MSNSHFPMISIWPLKLEWPYRLPDLPWLAGTAIAYALLAKLALAFFSAYGLVSAFWPSAGIALAAIVLGGPKYAVAVYIGALAGLLWAGKSPETSVIISFGEVLYPLLAAWLLSHKNRFDPSLRSSRDFFRLCFMAGLVSPPVNALIGVYTLLFYEHITASVFWYEFAHWWMGDALGVTIVFPLIVIWRQWPREHPWNITEAVLLFAVVFLIGQVAYFDWFSEWFGFVNRGYLMYLVIAWAAVRLGRHGVVLAVALTTLQALMGTANGLGFFSHDLARTQMTNFWVYTMVMAILGISLATILYERERVTAQLRSSEKHYSSLFSNLLDGVARCRMIFRDGIPVDYELVAVNPAFEKVTGLKDVVGRRISELIPNYVEDNKASMNLFGQVVRNGAPVRSEHHLVALDQWFSMAVYRPDPGEFVAIMENITERKRYENALRKLSLAVEQSPNSIVITDPNGEIEYVNPAFTHVSGYSAEEALGQNPRLLKSSLTSPETYRKLWTTLAAGRVWEGEFINRRKDGTHYHESATISPLYQKNGQLTNYVAIKTNITELKQTLDKLKSSENRLRIAKSAAGLGVFDFDLIEDKIELDQRARKLWGFGPDEPVTFDGFISCIHPDDQAAADNALVPGNNGKFNAELRILGREDGGLRHVAINSQAFFENGRATRFIGTVKDISAQKRLEKEIQARRGEMELLVTQQVAAQTISAIAHDLNQPLVSVSAYCETALRMLQKGLQSPEKLTYALEGAVEQSMRAGQLLHELLDFLHKGEAMPESVDLNSVVLDALAIADESGYGGFRPMIELDIGQPPVLANRLQLQKVLVNLLTNSVEAIRDGGSQAAMIHIRTQTMKDENMAMLTVQDNGPGLDAEMAHRIFEPFLTTKRKGIGLGLAISRALIEANGGQLWADSNSSPGATFHLTLPLAP